MLKSAIVINFDITSEILKNNDPFDSVPIDLDTTFFITLLKIMVLWII